ncbi:Rieske domain-containing protein [Acrasis kona]|uniref:Rieske domain-containing protein n=1 Tax=Acrasis kona TaxID=1008807 RepID=A0AAW2YQ70_9EUKA
MKRSKSEEEYVFATERFEDRKLVNILGRDVAFFNFGGDDIIAIDAHCYHKGGSLIEGDIEDIADRTCIVCPLHQYRIDLHTGECIAGGLGRYYSKGEKQRVHNIKICEDGIYIQKIDEIAEFDSDWYCDDTSELRKKRKRKMYY